MNIPRVRRTIEKHFGNKVQTFREGVLRTPYTTNGTVIGWFFFDLNQQIFNDRFDLKSYQDVLLSEDYYHATGSQQWNFYLFFICDPNNYRDPDNAALLRRIEKDKAFARKYVTTEDLLDSELPGAVQVSTPTERPTDISLRWEEKLRDARLDGVLMKSMPRTKVVESYLSGQPVRERQKSEARKAKGRTQFSAIKQLRITEGYRKYPEQKNFDFGPCNLIEGSNGSGKTSLLEAIELWTCGANFRDQLQSEDGRIGLLFEYGKGLEWNTTRGTQLYRQRDWQWYGNHYAKGNKLCSGFNRFNFYNTDAAVRLEETGRGEEKTVLNALSDLVLGETATMIEERAQSILAIFTEKQKGFQKLIKLQNSEVADARDELKALGPTKEKEADVLRRFVAQIKILGWTGALPASTRRSAEKFAAEFADVRDRFRRGQKNLWWLTTFDLATLSKEENTIADLVDKAERANKQTSEHMETINSLRNDVANVERETSLMRAYLPYITTPECSKLSGLKESIATTRQLLQLYRAVQNELRGADLQRYVEIEQPIATAISRMRSDIGKLSRRASDLAESVRSVKQHTETSTKLFATIRATASQLFAELPDLTNCPVCGAEYHLGQLKSLLLRAETVSEAVGDAKAFRELLEEQNKTEADLEHLRKESEVIRKINSAYSMLDERGSRTMVRSIVERLLQIPADVDRASVRHEELSALETRLGTKGLLETRYEQLRGSLQEIVDLGLLEAKAADKFEKRLKDKEKSLGAINDKISKLNSVIDTIRKRQVAGLNKYFKSSLTRTPEDELRRRQQTLVPILRSFLSDCERIKRGESLDITDINLRMDRIQTAYEEFLNAKKYLQESEHIKTRNAAKIERAEKELKSLNERAERARNAITTLTDILENDSKEKHLSSFLRTNTCEIADTFRLIHAPREFKDIEFDVERGQIVLTKTGSNKKLSVTKISSGQRAALALSVFLTLNRKVQNGPPFLIFDDPVAHIDDLNVLSFFDYLRETMLKLKRQIFFATANEKVSYLFKKKFDFLGDGFKVHPLSRTDARG
jgi:DNA repair exonuclease SbcCD ATPase subunit